VLQLRSQLPLQLRLDVPRQERFEVLGGRGLGQLGIEVGQIGMRLDAIGATRTNDGIQIRASLCAQLRITKKPNAAT
jgi:hypothetical protein